ncbi:MAG: methionyl-tRNA formyltransferase [Candidatus Marinimicrobia bacterium]|nr:methionyl-tRNA formyltransferase [Candidatus Neomarinimicrobiota bacterium]|tara:strand:- start:36 stop:962 length:927 start_codon:yes stop_codon:yes gene_type:complete
MRIVFMGNPVFAIESLEAIYKSNYDLIAVASNPPKSMGRHKQLLHTEVGNYAIKNNLNHIAIDDVKSDEFRERLEKLNPDIFVVVAYKILPDWVIRIPSYGAINLHPSLLPEFRGAAPIQWALMNGKKITGVSIFQIAEKVDSGDILNQKEIPIFPNDNYLSLSKRLSKIGANMIIKTLNDLDSGKTLIKPQDLSNVSFAPKISKKLTFIDWSWTSEKIHNWVRGLAPKPGMRTIIQNKQIRIFSTSIHKKSYKSKPGTIIFLTENKLQVSTGKGSLSIIDIQLEGKKRMTIEKFLRGFNVELGDSLG